jgi:parallel beta-helix repeat protein
MKRLAIFAAMLLAAFCLPAEAQFTPGQILTAAQLNAAFAGVLPLGGGTMTGQLNCPQCNITGGTISGLSAPLPFSSGGTNSTTAAAALTNLGGEPIGNATNKDVYVSNAGNDSNSGAGWGLAKLTLQAAVNAAGTNGVVHVGSGTYSLTSTLEMQPGVRLVCVDGATITQPNTQNLTLLIDFTSNSANGASLQNCIIDGNRSGNTDNSNDVLVYAGPANDVQIDNNIVRNGNGNGIEVTSGLRPRITRNRLTNLYTIGIADITGAAQTQTYGLIADNQILAPFGAFAIGTVEADYNNIQRNTIVGSQSLGANISISGTAVTWVSGPTFTSSMAGQTIVYNDGTEANIKTVNSSTSITLSNAGTTVTNVPAIIGSADLLNVANSSFNNISDNTISGGATSSIVLHNFTASESAQKNIISRNIVGKNGEGCIYLETVSGSQLFDNTITDNNINDCGTGGTTAGVSVNAGIGLLDFSPTTLLRTFIDGNYVSYDGATGTPMGYWLETPAIGVGQAFIGKNTGYGMTNTGIYNGISSVTLGSGWGSTATTANIISYGSSFQVTVTSAGTGQTANASVTVNTRATTPDDPPVMNCKYTGGTGVLNSVYGEEPGTNSGPAAQAFVFAGTPAAGSTYQFLCRG